MFLVIYSRNYFRTCRSQFIETLSSICSFESPRTLPETQTSQVGAVNWHRAGVISALCTSNTVAYHSYGSRGYRSPETHGAFYSCVRGLGGRRTESSQQPRLTVIDTTIDAFVVVFYPATTFLHYSIVS